MSNHKIRFFKIRNIRADVEYCVAVDARDATPEETRHAYTRHCCNRKCGMIVEMSDLRNMALRETLPIIGKLFESFGIKSILCLKDNEWINVVTVIHLTRRKVEDLNEEYRLLEKRVGRIESDRLKVTLWARPISEFSNALTEIEAGCLKIGDLNTKILAKAPEKAFDQKINDWSRVLRVGEFAAHNCYSVTLPMNDNSDHVLLNFGISAQTLGLRDINDLGRSWLGLETLQNNENVHIIFPIYATLGEIHFHGGNEIRATVKMDKRWFGDSKVWLIRKGEGDYAPVLERMKYDLVSCENVTQDGFVYVSLMHSFSAVGPRDRIFASLVSNELGLLDVKEAMMYHLTGETSDLFAKAFALFDAGKKIEEHLLNPHTDEDFVASVSWLLELIGTRCLKLGRDEIVRENQTEKGSADIIAYDPESKEMLVVDCTIGVPSEPKIDRIKSTADYISRKITVPAKPVIFTAKNVPAAKELADRCGVKVVDNFDLGKLIVFCKKGFDYPARKIVLESA